MSRCPDPCTDDLLASIARFLMDNPSSLYGPLLARIADYFLDRAEPASPGFVSVELLSFDETTMTTRLKFTLVPPDGKTSEVAISEDGGDPTFHGTDETGAVTLDFTDVTSISYYGTVISPFGVRSDPGPTATRTMSDFDKPAAPGEVSVELVSQTP